jgi:hypothetical protein
MFIYGADVSRQHSLFNPLNTIVRKWRYIVAMVRAGRAHSPTGAAGTKEGELAIFCPSCPRPGYNLPENWKDMPEYVYSSLEHYRSDTRTGGY